MSADHLIGVDINEEYTNGICPIPVGAEETINNCVYRLVRLTGPRTRGLTYDISSTGTLGSGITTAAAANPAALGTPQRNFVGPDAGVTNSFGWVAVEGQIPFIFGIGGATSGLAIFTTSVAGVLHSSQVASGIKVNGMVFGAAVAAGASNLTNAYAFNKMYVG